MSYGRDQYGFGETEEEQMALSNLPPNTSNRQLESDICPKGCTQLEVLADKIKLRMIYEEAKRDTVITPLYSHRDWVNALEWVLEQLE